MNGNRAGGGLNVLDLVAIGVAALIVVLEAGLWLWAGAAGVLFGSGWPRLTPGALPHAIAGVAGHLSDPRQGFPARLRPGLPGPSRLLPHAGVPGVAARDRGRGRDQAPPPRSRERLGRPQAPRRSLGPGGRPGSLTPHAPRTPARPGPPVPARRTSAACDGARTLARLPGYAAAPRGGPPRAGRVRPDAVGQVGGDRDPEHPRMGRAGDRRVDQARPPRRDARRPRAARQGAGVRPARSVEAAEPHVVAARRREQLERGAPDRAADGLRRRDGHQHRQRRELLVPGRRATARPAPLRGRAHRPRDGRGRALGLRPGRRRA